MADQGRGTSFQIRTKISGRKAVEGLLKDVPDLTLKFTRTELVRTGKRFRRTFLKERLKGRPGIFFPAKREMTSISGNIKSKRKRTGAKTRTLRQITDKRVGKNVRSFVPRGIKHFADLKWVSKISRFLTWHEKGTTGRHAVPARLGFERKWNRDMPGNIIRIKKAMSRAKTVANERSRKKAIADLKKVVGASFANR